MNGYKTLIASVAAAAVACVSVPAFADQDELDVTMEVIDDLSEIDDGLVRMRGPEEDDFEIDPNVEIDGDDEGDERSLVDQFEEMDGDFEVRDENDGFEFEDQDETAWDEFESESDLEEGENLDFDEFDEIEDVMEDDLDVESEESVE